MTEVRSLIWSTGPELFLVHVPVVRVLLELSRLQGTGSFAYPGRLPPDIPPSVRRTAIDRLIEIGALRRVSATKVALTKDGTDHLVVYHENTPLFEEFGKHEPWLLNQTNLNLQWLDDCHECTAKSMRRNRSYWFFWTRKRKEKEKGHG